MTEASPSIGQIVGRNLRLLRELDRQSQADVARRIHECTGQAWTRAEVASLELGRRQTITLEDLLTLACTYKIPMADLLSGDGPVSVGHGFHVEASGIRRALCGSLVEQPAYPTEGHDGSSPHAWEADTDKAVANRLGLTRDQASDAALNLWGRSISEERDARLGDVSDLPPRRLQGRRGAMTRTLTVELKAKVSSLGQCHPQ